MNDDDKTSPRNRFSIAYGLEAATAADERVNRSNERMHHISTHLYSTTDSANFNKREEQAHSVRIEQSQYGLSA